MLVEGGSSGFPVEALQTAAGTGPKVPPPVHLHGPDGVVCQALRITRLLLAVHEGRSGVETADTAVRIRIWMERDRPAVIYVPPAAAIDPSIALTMCSVPPKMPANEREARRLVARHPEPAAPRLQTWERRDSHLYLILPLACSS